MKAEGYRNAVTRFDKEAADLIYKTKNPKHEHGKGLKTCDLHLLFTKEVVPYAREHLARCRAFGVKRTEIITGRGNHSKDGVPQLFPVISEFLVAEGVKFRVANHLGSFAVKL